MTSEERESGGEVARLAAEVHDAVEYGGEVARLAAETHQAVEYGGEVARLAAYIEYCPPSRTVRWVSKEWSRV